MSSNAIQPTDRSPGILLSFPPDLLQPIFHQVLLDELYNTNQVSVRRSLRTVRFGAMVHRTKNIRGVCGSWTRALHSLVFHGKETRDGITLRLRRLMFDKDIETFPMLRDCMVKLGHPYFLRDLYSLQQDMAKSTISFEYVCAVVWYDDEIMDVMRNHTSHLGYGRLSHELVNTFADECVSLGMKVVDCNAKRTNGMMDVSEITEEWVRGGRTALENFYFKECLALWYFNAHMVRQILSAFPRLEYVEFPDFLHVPLLAKMKYFFPQCNDDSPFAPISLSPPQMLQNLGITYREQGRSYSDIMASIKRVTIGSYHYNPILSLFNGSGHGRLSVNLYGFLVMNRWKRPQDPDMGSAIIHRLTDHMKAAVRDIPEKTRAKVTHFDVDKLMDVMYDTAGYSP